MRTTLTLDDDLAKELKKRAFQQDKAFKQVVNEALRAGLASDSPPARRRRYRVRPAALGRVRPGVDLDRILRLAGDLEDEGIARKLEQRK